MLESPLNTAESAEQTLRLTASSRAEVLAQVAREVAAPCPELDAAAIEAALVAREEARSTAVGDGFALPHAVLPTLEHPTSLRVSFERPVIWDDTGGQVDHCVVILVPPGREGVHLKLVAEAVAQHQGDSQG